MIGLILDLLKTDKFIGKSEVIDFAKGKNQLKLSANTIKRNLWQGKKK